MPPPWRVRPRPPLTLTVEDLAPPAPKNVGASTGSAHNATVKVEEKK